MGSGVSSHDVDSLQPQQKADIVQCIKVSGRGAGLCAFSASCAATRGTRCNAARVTELEV